MRDIVSFRSDLTDVRFAEMTLVFPVLFDVLVDILRVSKNLLVLKF